MIEADSVHSTPPLNTPTDPEVYRTPLSSYLIEAFAIVVMLILGTTCGCLIVSNLEGKIAHRCAKDLSRVLQ